jgi:hypothetical protein
MRIKKIFFLLVAALLANCGETGCESNQIPKTELEKLPPVTQTGENTFGCLVNGKAWVPESNTDATAYYQLKTLQIGAATTSDGVSLVLLENNSILTKGVYTLVNNEYSDTFFYKDINNDPCYYEKVNVLDGELTITTLDFTKAILSGQFEFGVFIDATCDTLKITNGRFDLSLIL